MGTKSRAKTRLVEQAHGGALKQGNTVNVGRPPDEFKAMCRALASSDKVREKVQQILADPDAYPKLYIGALNWATEHGYGKPKESVELTGKDGGPIQIWKIGKREIRF